MERYTHMSSAAATLDLLPTPEALVGEFRRLGPFGPAYKVVAVHRDEDGRVWLRALVIETGETFDRRYELALRDPLEE